MTLRVCNVPGCPRHADRRGKCTPHAAAAEAQRGTAAARGYDSAWQRRRLEVLERDDWTCRIGGPRCRVSATTVDHIIPLSEGGARLDPANLRAACSPCNYALGGAVGARRREARQ
jgi:5-methylcytosine-specific restriction protein A